MNLLMLQKVPPTGTDSLPSFLYFTVCYFVLDFLSIPWFIVLFLTIGSVLGCSYAIKKKDEIERVAKANR